VSPVDPFPGGDNLSAQRGDAEYHIGVTTVQPPEWEGRSVRELPYEWALLNTESRTSKGGVSVLRRGELTSMVLRDGKERNDDGGDAAEFPESDELFGVTHAKADYHTSSISELLTRSRLLHTRLVDEISVKHGRSHPERENDCEKF
jgi:hypothetical protein